MKYCDNCKYFESSVFFEKCFVGQKHLKHINRWGGYASPHIENRNNNCKDYKRVWWKIWVKEK